MNLIPIQSNDLRIEQPLPWNLYDQDHKLLFKRGAIIKSNDELEKLSELSIYRNDENQPEQSGLSSIQFDFKHINFRVGDKLQIKLHSDAKASQNSDNNDYFTAVVMGYVPNKTLIIYLSNVDQLVGYPLLEGDQTLIRYFNSQYIFSFTVFIEHIVKLPFKYVHLSLPKHVLRQTVRKSLRIECNVEAKITLNNQSYTGTLINLSTTGAGLNIRSSDLGENVGTIGENGSPADVAFDIAFQEKVIPLSLHSKIRSFNTGKNEDGGLSYGLEFLQLTPDQIVMLRSFIYKEIIDNYSKVI